MYESCLIYYSTRTALQTCSKIAHTLYNSLTKLSKMYIVKTIFLDSDDFQVESNVFPCDTKETTQALAEKIYIKALEENHDFTRVDKETWIKYNVWRDENTIHITGSDAGFGKITIEEKEVLSIDGVDNVEIGSCYYY